MAPMVDPMAPMDPMDPMAATEVGHGVLLRLAFQHSPAVTIGNQPHKQNV